MYVFMYVQIRRHAPAHARTRAHRTQARGATPELRRVTQTPHTTSHGLSAAGSRHSTQTTIGYRIGSPSPCGRPTGSGGGGGTVAD